MKKSLILILLIMLVSGTRANIATPQAYISEIYVDSLGNWTVEMGFDPDMIQEIDSIYLVTSGGSSRIAYFSLIPGGGYPNFDSLAIVTIENLVNPVSINPDGDYVKLISYAWGDNPDDSVSFGNYPGSYLNCMFQGESVIFLAYDNGQDPGYRASYCVDVSPTIGYGNDTTGAMISFSGNAYDLYGNPFSAGFFMLPGVGNTRIHILEDGSFSERIFSRRYAFNAVGILLYPWPYTIADYNIEPVDFCIFPDSSHYQDIITTSLIIGVDENEEPEANTVTIAPNPFSDKVDFYFNLKNPEEEKDFAIYSIDGKKILQTRIADNQRKYEWRPSSEIPSGTYIYRLESRKGTIKTGKFVRL